VTKGRKRFGDAFNEAQFKRHEPQIIFANRPNTTEFTTAIVAAQQANDLKEYKQIILDCDIADPISGTKNWTDVRQFNLMFSTQISNTGEDG
jgi:glycyl-tRNA synthetase